MFSVPWVVAGVSLVTGPNFSFIFVQKQLNLLDFTTAKVHCKYLGQVQCLGKKIWFIM